MTSLLSLPAFPRKLHRARHRFTGGLSPSLAHACRQWLRYGISTRKVTPDEAVKALREGDHQAGSIAAAIARSCVRRPSASKVTLHSIHEYDRVSVLLKWLVRAGEIAAVEIPGLLREPQEAVTRIQCCFKEAESEARRRVAAMYADDVPFDHPLWEIHLSLAHEDDPKSLCLALHLCEPPFAHVPLHSPALPYLARVAHAYNTSSSFTFLSAPDRQGIEHIDWSLTEYVDDVLLRHSQGISMRDAVDQVSEESGCDPDWLQGVVEEVEAVENARFQHGPLTQRQASVLSSIDRLIAALPRAGAWKYGQNSDEGDELHCVPGIVPGELLHDLACEQLDTEFGSVGSFHGALVLPSSPTSHSLRQLYIELHLHSAVIAHVRHLS